LANTDQMQKTFRWVRLFPILH